MKVECQNCEKVLEDSECREAKDLLERHSFGDIFSDLECPRCGALCYPVNTGWEREFVQELLTEFPSLDPVRDEDKVGHPEDIDKMELIRFIYQYMEKRQ